MRSSIWTVAWGLTAVAASGPALAEAGGGDRAFDRIYITHFSHTDFGFTDLPTVCRELQQRYLDVALDAVLATLNGPPERKFYWTAESLVAVHDWWETASPSRREDFLRALRSGQLEVTALPCNQTPFLDAGQWQTMLHWVPEDLWRRFRPTAALQNDVNGFPRAGAMALLDRGIRHLSLGINADSGGPPFYRPSAFWWKMPDGRRLFVWLNHHYGSGFDFFETSEWRRGPVPSASDTRFRPPRAGDFFRTDEASLRAAHQQCLRRLAALRQEGYAHPVLTISITSQWRMDNDPPFPPLADFVAAWNQLGLKPELRLTTVSRAIQAMEQALGSEAPEYQGEFTDWWANGTACAPREVAASRSAKRLLAAAQSPLWGALDAPAAVTTDQVRKDLCLFDEHTWGSSWSVAFPWSLDTVAQFAEKSLFAYRPMARAEWLLSQRVRGRLLREGDGLFVANPAGQPWSGWVRLPIVALRGDCLSLEPSRSGERIPLFFEPGVRPWSRPQNPAELTRENSAATFPDNAPRQVAKFWVERIPANTFVRMRLCAEAADAQPAPPAGPTVTLDASGWPASAQWPGMKKPLFLESPGDFLAVKVKAFAPRWALQDLSGAGEAGRRDELRAQHVEIVTAVPEANAQLEETPHTLLYSQWLRHPRLKWLARRIELWKQAPRARLTLRLHRLASEDPEILYASFRLPCEGVLPRLSCGGLPFRPFLEQLPGSCRDYFAIDGWAHYATVEGDWLWVSRDAPLMTLGGPQVWTRRQDPPPEAHRLLAMLFNNFWYTNFAADEHGVMEFQFDLVWRERSDTTLPAQELADSLTAEAVTLLNSGGADSPILLQRLFAP